MADLTIRNEERLVRYLDSEDRTVSTNSTERRTPVGSTGIILTFNIQSPPTIGALNLSLQFKAGVNGYKTVFKSLNVSTQGPKIFLISPHAVAWDDLNEILVSPIPIRTRVRVIHTQAGQSATYSVHGEFI